MNNLTSLLQCECGCGGSPKKGRFLPGHDRKLMCCLIRRAINGDSDARPTLALLGWERFLHEAEASAVRKLTRPKLRSDRQKKQGLITFAIPKGRLSAPSFQTETKSPKKAGTGEAGIFPLRVGPRSFQTLTEFYADQKPDRRARRRNRLKSGTHRLYRMWMSRMQRSAGR